MKARAVAVELVSVVWNGPKVGVADNAKAKESVRHFF